MDDFINQFVDKVADFLAGRPGLLPLLGIFLVIVNFLLQLFPGSGNWIVDSNILLHLGVVVSIIGLLLIRPLG